MILLSCRRNGPSVAFEVVMLRLSRSLCETQGLKVAETGATGQPKQHKTCRPVEIKALIGLIG